MSRASGVVCCGQFALTRHCLICMINPPQGEFLSIGWVTCSSRRRAFAVCEYARMETTRPLITASTNRWRLIWLGPESCGCVCPCCGFHSDPEKGVKSVGYAKCRRLLW